LGPSCCVVRRLGLCTITKCTALIRRLKHF